MNYIKVILFILLCNSTVVFAGGAAPLSSTRIQRIYPVKGQGLPEAIKSLNANKRQAVVVGAGIAGLMSALILNYEKMDVIVVERRTLNFNRLNTINMKKESAVWLKKLGIMDDFLQIANQIETHEYYKKADKSSEFKLINTTLPGYSPLVDNLTFDANGDFFKSDGLFTIVIGQFQQMLAHKAMDRGIPIVGSVDAEIIGETIQIKDEFNHAYSLKPNLIIVATGAHTEKSAIKTESQVIESHPCHKENWVFQNVNYSGHRAFVNVLIDLSDPKDPEISNIIYDPKRGKASIAMTVKDSKMDEVAVKKNLLRVAETSFKLFELDTKNIVLENAHAAASNVVTVYNRIVKFDRKTLGSNVIFAGDSFVSSSPLSGLGGTLATTSFSYGVSRLASSIVLKREFDPSLASDFQEFDEQSLSYAWFWINHARKTKNKILSL